MKSYIAYFPASRTDMKFSQKSYYDKKYYSWQKQAGLYGAVQDIWMYQSFIKNSDVVLDFGCGGGYLLERLVCKKKYGIDINLTAQKEARKKDITVFSNFEEIPHHLKFDVIYSHHTLEHVQNPAEVLFNFQKYLKPHGLVVIVVPIDDWRNQKKYTTKDINKHLYTWTPLLLGNLFVSCGYKIQDVRIIATAWLPLSRFYFHYIPGLIYYTLSSIWSALIRSRQIRIVASIK